MASSSQILQSQTLVPPPPPMGLGASYTADFDDPEQLDDDMPPEVPAKPSTSSKKPLKGRRHAASRLPSQF
ncbi:hypothetical protein DL93DRAFT_2079698 [Clavulina sp. PMI_390]|nr:hypothetical protein DL93DRAFT_2079698 [Clavulina sp. PMI_390]